MNSATGLTSQEAEARLHRDGPNEVPEKPSRPLRRFASKFWGLSAWMIELIALLSLFLNKQADFWIAIALLLVNAVLSFLQEQRASAAVDALRRKLQISARVLRDGTWQLLPARNLVKADVIRLRSGDFVPADAKIVEGELGIDQSALTGESQNLYRNTGEEVHSGSIVREGEATAEVTATGINTYYGRTTELVESAHPKLHVEEVISRVVRWLLLIVGTLVAITVIASLIQGFHLFEVLPLSLVLLVSAVPVALPVMFTVSMSVGSIELSRLGVLVTRLSAAEDAANMDVLCADKTGTLTLNRLTLTDVQPQPGFSESDVIRYGALASNEADQDPIDLAFLRAAAERSLTNSRTRIVSFSPFSAATRRTEAVVEDGAKRLRIMKGALATLAHASGLDAAALQVLEANAAQEAQKGFRMLAVACAEADGPLKLVGTAFLYDAPRPDSHRLVEELRSLGVAVKMLTGDALAVARNVGSSLGLSEIIKLPERKSAQESAASIDLINRADGFAEVFPEDKFTVVKGLQAAGHIVGMTGDGVNDAPALRQAEIGIAVSGATDVAKGAASVVLTTEGLAGIVNLVKNGRAIYQRVLTWIINKISRTILKAGFVVAAFLITGKFVISALGMVLLIFMTDFVKIALSTDNTHPSQKPETWKIAPLVRIAVLLGILMLLESLGLFAIGWHGFHLAHDMGRLQTFTFEALLFFALFSILSIRERRAFWRSRPGTVLSIALFADACAGIAIGRFGLAELKPLPFEELGAIIGYAFATSLLLNDIVKTVAIRRSGRSTKDATAPKMA